MRWQGGVGGRPRRPGRPGCWENKGHRPVLPNKSEDPVQPHSPRLLHVREKQTALVTAAATTRQGSLSRSSSQRGGHTVWQHLHHFPVPPTPHEGPGPRPPLSRRARGDLYCGFDVCFPRACTANTRLSCPLAEKIPAFLVFGSSGSSAGWS